MEQSLHAFWALPSADLLRRLQTTTQGLSGRSARRRLTRHGPNLLTPKKRSDAPALLLAQFKSPIILILLAAAGLSFFLRNPTDALIILTIVLVSSLLGFWQERGAAGAIEKLLAIVEIKAMVLRDGRQQEIPVARVVPGDLVILNAGDVIPGDGMVVESKDLFVDEAALTGETYPVEKAAGVCPPDAPLGQRTNSLWMGTHVVSGTAAAAVVRTGVETEFGKVAGRLRLRPPETEFERGIRRFGYLLMEVTLLLVIAIFAINVYLDRPVLDAFLFSLALAVGLTPQLLPAIITINLSHGAKRMAAQQVIVKRLASIENFGGMDVLCVDKTGTLTEGRVRLHSALDMDGRPNEKVLFYAALNASYETGFTNPIDQAIRDHRSWDLHGCRKLDEVPYDFIRKRLSILVEKDGALLMITKGALTNVLAVCSSVETAEGTNAPLASMREALQARFEALSREGFRTLGVACRTLERGALITKEDESGMTFLGFLVFFDPPKPGIIETIRRLKALGISLKIVTGDNRLVTAWIARQVGLERPRMLTGPELARISDDALRRQIAEIELFAEVEPNQKERIILALRKAGHVVGYLGDGINDASALHTADVGISVEGAVDVAKEAADLVLLEKNLSVLVEGVREGRTTFANTLKYVFMATSANFGNMFSMAGASLFLSFLPLLPKQILLTNLLTDLPEMTIATDRVDAEMTDRPRRWNLPFIRRFMFTFGLVSSVFDYLTFGVLLWFLHASTEEFRTGWFVESVVSASLIVLVVRSRRPFFRSRPGRSLWLATLLTVAVTVAIPFLPLGTMFGFSALPPSFLLAMGVIIALYVLAAEMVKGVFYKKVAF
ncbi:MAG: magnesium-translocating P-type ATPase [Nitrospirae bacterium]|nr:magnesium-translocating P-type ATPase [Nitrospirota bacterium]